MTSNELIIDNFAGGGGASTAIERALGRPVDIAINHDREALAMHAANHPETQHLCEDVWKVDIAKVVDGRPVGLAWFSPDCKHFSKAKGGKPVEKRIRGLAWVALRWAGIAKPRVIILENVEEFQDWGPLVGDRPCPRRKGMTFRRWVTQLRNLGYDVDWRELRACDFGAPTIRKRLFVVARRDGQPIVWPEPTHGKGRIPYRTAAECIDWSIPCPSIFLTSKEGRKIGVNRPLAEATMRRIARGVKRYVIDAAEPFIVGVGGRMGHLAEVRAFLMKYYGTYQDPHLEEPLHTVTSRDRFGLVIVHGEPYQIVDIGMRMLTPRELFLAQGFPPDYIIDGGRDVCQEQQWLTGGEWVELTKTAQVRMCGNSVSPPPAEALVRAQFRAELGGQEERAA